MRCDCKPVVSRKVLVHGKLLIGAATFSGFGEVCGEVCGCGRTPKSAVWRMESLARAFLGAISALGKVVLDGAYFRLASHNVRPSLINCTEG